VLVSTTDKAWAAGFLDGEGCFQLAKANPSKRHLRPRYSLIIRCTNTNLPALERLQSLFGGAIHACKRDLRGAYRPTWTWNLCGKGKVLRALRQIFSYLTIKREESWLMVEYLVHEIKLRSGPGLQDDKEALERREFFYRALREAKRVS